MGCTIIVTEMRFFYRTPLCQNARVLSRFLLSRFPALILAAIVLFALPMLASAQTPQAAVALAQSDPEQLVQQVCANEIRNFSGSRQPLRYKLRKITARGDTTKEIVETRQGGVARLIALHGEPLSEMQRQNEDARLQKVHDDPAVEAHRQRMEQRDTARIVNLTRALPQAFLYRYAGTVDTPQGLLIRLTLKPNTHWTPPDFESRILTGIRGEMLIDAQALRVQRVEGHVFRGVDFGWKLLGVLYPGGDILFEQAPTPCCGWQLSHLRLRMDGKALMLKPIRIDVEEFASDYSRTPAGWGYRQAAEWLLGPEWQS
jgi:hypothetical protein